MLTALLEAVHELLAETKGHEAIFEVVDLVQATLKDTANADAGASSGGTAGVAVEQAETGGGGGGGGGHPRQHAPLDQSAQGVWATMPTEIMCKIFGYACTGSLLSASLACWHWRRCAVRVACRPRAGRLPTACATCASGCWRRAAGSARRRQEPRGLVGAHPLCRAGGAARSTGGHGRPLLTRCRVVCVQDADARWARALDAFYSRTIGCATPACGAEEPPPLPAPSSVPACLPISLPLPVRA